MTHPMRLPALSLLTLLGVTTACNGDCPEGQMAIADPQGTRRVCVAASEGSSSGETTETTTETTTEPPLCDDDPACGPDEDATRCPSQCNVCGDGIVFGDEACDNGDNNRSYWPNGAPADACSDACDLDFHRCGDAILDPDDGEACDNGSNDDPAHAPTKPAADACAPGCQAVRFCGDATLDTNDGEACDNGPQNQSYWPEAPPARACSNACDAAFEWCGDAIPNGPEACDNGENLDPAYSPTIPDSPSPCATACTSARFCGDTILDPADGETCDDGNNTDGDGCSADCLHTERHVFVSSTTFKGDMSSLTMPPLEASVMGVARGDDRCQALAAAAGLPGTYKAWLSDSTDSPSTRFDTRFTGLYRLNTPGNPIVASGWSGLTTKPLLHPIDADENGAAASGEIVWTNTLPTGTPASNLHCNNWSSIIDIDTTTVGSSSKTDPTWTKVLTGQSCALTNRLYCFEDPA